MIVEEIPAALAGERLDRVVALVTEASRSDSTGLVNAGAVTVDGAVATSGKVRLREGQVVAIDETKLPVPLRPAPDPSVDVPVVHVDDDIIVIDKPAGLVVHPGAGHPDGTLVNGLLARFPELAGVGEPHRPGHRPSPRRRHQRVAGGGPQRRGVRPRWSTRSPPTGSSARTGRWRGACRRTRPG